MEPTVVTPIRGLVIAAVTAVCVMVVRPDARALFGPPLVSLAGFAVPTEPARCVTFAVPVVEDVATARARW